MPTKEEMQIIIADSHMQNSIPNQIIARLVSSSHSMIIGMASLNSVLMPDILRAKLASIMVDGYAIEKFIRKNCEVQDITPSELCKKVNVTRNTWSKICNAGRTGYKPSKNTLIQFALGLELTLEESVQLLKLGGYNFSSEDQFDRIVALCIQYNYNDVDKVNELLLEGTNKTLF